MIDKFKPKLPRLPYPFIPPFDPPSEQPPYIPPESSGGDDEGSSNDDPGPRPPWWPEDWPWPPPPDEPVVIEAPPPLPNEHISWVLDSARESSTAPGDSGGPGYINVGGKLMIAGVTSGGSGDAHSIGSDSFDVRVDTLASWIDSVVGTVSNVPIVGVMALDSVAAETRSGLSTNTGSFQIARSGLATSPLTVNLSMAGSATSDVDFNRIPTTVTIPAGASSVIVTLSPIDDSLAEPVETVVLALTSQSGYRVDNALKSATITIADNDSALSNNLFANRQRLRGTSASATGSNVGANREAGEPNIEGVSGGKSVWWTWTANATGRVTVSTAGSSFDTTLGIYTGNSVNARSRVASNDDNPQAEDYSSQLSFNAIAGRTYQIAVDGYDGATGSINLSLNQTAALSFANGQLPTSTAASSSRSTPLALAHRDNFFRQLGTYNNGRSNQGHYERQATSLQMSPQTLNTNDSDVPTPESLVDGCLMEVLDDELLLV